MTYREALERLFALRRFGVRPGLGPIKAALERLGHPERAFPAVHIAGTNGKGSTAAMCEAVLRADGRRVGLYTSPHLSRFTERIRIDGAELAEDQAAALAEEVLAAGPTLTFFEVVTAMAFVAFARARVDIAVVEVGLGGRLDATNALGDPRVSVITSIGLEHTEILGDTVEAIAAEKAGILRPGVPAVANVRDPGARRVIGEVAASVGAPIAWLGEDLIVEGAVLHDGGRHLPYVAPALPGAHQRDNAALALTALDRLPDGLRPSDAARAAIAQARWPGRLERIGDVVLDGAHNPEGANALAAALPEIAAGRPIALVLGVVEDKDAAALAAPLLPQVIRLVATTPPSPRARAAEELAALLAPLVGESALSLEVVPDPMDAVAAAGRDGALVVAAGSLFLVGALRAQLLGERVDPVVVQDPAPIPRTGG